MNKLAVLCVLVVCVTLTHGLRKYGRRYPTRPILPTRYCYDFQGRRILPGQSYYDGCNTCTCGSFGQPTICTKRACHPIKPVKPVHPVEPVWPVDPIDPIWPPVDPIKPVKPTYPVDPIKPVKPIYPVDPIKPVKPTWPVNPARPVLPRRPVFPVAY